MQHLQSLPQTVRSCHNLLCPQTFWWRPISFSKRQSPYNDLYYWFPATSPTLPAIFPHTHTLIELQPDWPPFLPSMRQAHSHPGAFIAAVPSTCNILTSAMPMGQSLTSLKYLLRYHIKEAFSGHPTWNRITSTSQTPYPLYLVLLLSIEFLFTWHFKYFHSLSVWCASPY